MIVNSAVLITRGCLAPSHNLQAVFLLRIYDTKGRLGSEAFLAGTVETGNKKREDFHCMQMRLVMSMWFIFGDD